MVSDPYSKIIFVTVMKHMEKFCYEMAIQYTEVWIGMNGSDALMLWVESACITSCRSIDVTCQMHVAECSDSDAVEVDKGLFCDVLQSSKQQWNFYLVRLSSFADVNLPRLELVQPNKKLYKVKLLQRGDHVKIYLASDAPLYYLQASMGVVVLTIQKQQTPQTEVS